jgi:hypothetical protein
MRHDSGMCAVKPRAVSRWFAVGSIGAVLLIHPVVALAQDPGPPSSVEVPVGPVAAQGVEASTGPDQVTLQSTYTAPESREPDANGLGQLLKSVQLPILFTLVVAFTGLVAGVTGAIGSVFVTPRTMKAIAERQTGAALEGVEVAARSAVAASDSAKAAARNAEAAVLNAHNTGVHAVARLRQEWINTVREEIAELHSALMNFTVLEPNERLGGYDTAVGRINVRLARVRLLLNPNEVASKNLLVVLDRLNSTRLETNAKMRLCRWVIRWGQIVLKTEWDRVARTHAATAPSTRGASLDLAFGV